MNNEHIEKFVATINEVIDDFRGKLSYAETVGALEIVKMEIATETPDEQED